jgi:cell division protein FtsB
MMMRRLINSSLKNSYNLINKQHYVVNNSEWELYNKQVFNSYSHLSLETTYSNNKYQTIPVTNSISISNYNTIDILSDTIYNQTTEIKHIKMEIDTLNQKINSLNKQLEYVNNKLNYSPCVDI